MMDDAGTLEGENSLSTLACAGGYRHCIEQGSQRSGETIVFRGPALPSCPGASF